MEIRRENLGEEGDKKGDKKETIKNKIGDWSIGERTWGMRKGKKERKD